jgi:O-antigen ligase
MWQDRTGHHFHSFYLDRAFYFGIIGLVMVLLVPIIRTGQRLWQPGPMRSDTALLIAYFGCLLVFSASYDWSTYHFGLLGLLLAYLAEPEPQPSSLISRPAKAVARPAPSHAYARL